MRTDASQMRRDMVENCIAARGICSDAVLEAMGSVPRESFVPENLREFAYEDAPLPIGEGQTISQPYIVAFMVEASSLEGGERVLEIGTGSGYAAAVLGEIAGEVYTVERIGRLAEKAASVLADLGYSNVHVLHGDGTLGWKEHAPYDAIIVSAGGPDVPDSLRDQLKVGGRLVIPVGFHPHIQELVRVTRVSEERFESEDIADVRFVPLVGEEGWAPAPTEAVPPQRVIERPRSADAELAKIIAACCEPFEDIDSTDLGPLLDRIDDARVVLLGEETHGSAEFYRMRARISRELITRKNFSFVAIEGDWPDAARIDDYVRGIERAASEWQAFAWFPEWMWRNREVRDFVGWLRTHNAHAPPDRRVAFHGLDLYSLYTSIGTILEYLDDVDPGAARIARDRYGRLTPWQADPATYGEAALTGTYRAREGDVTRMLIALLENRSTCIGHNGGRFLDTVQNARSVSNAERYYRTMYYGSRASWHLRDRHMYHMLLSLLHDCGKDSRAIVWAHNSHVGDASATEMTRRGKFNIGRRCRMQFGPQAYSIGFGTHRGTVSAASNWDEPMEVKTVRPATERSYERLCHESGCPGFTLGLGESLPADLERKLSVPRLERAIGVIYRPETELASHYFQAVLPKQFDEYIWFDETSAVTPLKSLELERLPDTESSM